MHKSCGDSYINKNIKLCNKKRESACHDGSPVKCMLTTDHKFDYRNKTNDLILNLTPENVTQHSRIVTTTHKGSSTPTKMSKIIGRQIH